MFQTIYHMCETSKSENIELLLGLVLMGNDKLPISLSVKGA